MLGFLATACILVSVAAGGILCSYFRSIPYIRKNILTRLDELLVLNSTIFVCVQCSICLFSLLCKARNDFLYLAFYVVLYGSLVIGFGVTIGLSCSRVLIIILVRSSLESLSLKHPVSILDYQTYKTLH